LEIRAKIKARPVPAAKPEARQSVDAPEAVPETADYVEPVVSEDFSDDGYAAGLAEDTAADMGEDSPGSQVEWPAEQHEADSVASEDEECDEDAAKAALGDAAADLFKDFFPEQETQSLRNQSAESRIEQKRHELFAELDSLQEPQPASDAWLEYCNLNTTSGRWFKELD
jgi:hypothetical protein